MKPEQQRIAIAEACGWTGISYWGAGGINGKHPKEPWTEVIPDYLNDLNAMHEAEDTMYDGQLWIEYENVLTTAMDHVGGQFHATAAQRAEAFLKALNLWKP